MVAIETVLQGFSAGTNEGSLAYCSVALLRGQHLTLVDVGYHARLLLLLERLKQRGIEPGDIERVVLTHAHWDHALNLSLFPNAEVMLLREEYDYSLQPHPEDWATPPWVGDIFRRCRKVTTLRDGDELEPGVRVMAVPGHSPGTMATLVETPDGIAGLVGDALPSRAAAGFMAPSIIFYDEELARRSAQKIVDTCRVVYPGHDRPFGVENGTFRYIETTGLVLTNPPREEDGTLIASISDAPGPTGPVIVGSARKASDMR